LKEVEALFSQMKNILKKGKLINVINAVLFFLYKRGNTRF